MSGDRLNMPSRGRSATQQRSAAQSVGLPTSAWRTIQQDDPLGSRRGVPFNWVLTHLNNTSPWSVLLHQEAYTLSCRVASRHVARYPPGAVRVTRCDSVTADIDPLLYLYQSRMRRGGGSFGDV